MLPDRVLANFKHYIETHPRGPASDPQGAYDALPSRLRGNRAPLIRDFKAGGAYDSVGGMVESVMQFCHERGMKDEDLEKLGQLLNQPAEDEDWSEDDEREFQALEKRRKAPAEDEPAPFPGRPRPGGKMDPVKATTTGMDSARQRETLEAFRKRIGDNRTIRVLG